MRHFLIIGFCLLLSACGSGGGKWDSADSRTVRTKGHDIIVKTKPTNDGGFDLMTVDDDSCMFCGSGDKEAQEAAALQRMNEMCSEKFSERQRSWRGGGLEIRFRCS